MAIFNSYVSLPEGNGNINYQWWIFQPCLMTRERTRRWDFLSETGHLLKVGGFLEWRLIYLGEEKTQHLGPKFLMGLIRIHLLINSKTHF
jgi:hypothetical protein